MAEDREVAGIRCMQVLELLPDYLDAALLAGRAEQIEEHLRGCDWCEHFGGEYASAVAALRRQLGAPSPPPDPVRRRLRERLWREVGGPE